MCEQNAQTGNEQTGFWDGSACLILALQVITCPERKGSEGERKRERTKVVGTELKVVTWRLFQVQGFVTQLE